MGEVYWHVWLGAFVASGLTNMAGIKYFLGVAWRHQLLDQPNDRSTHARATPRGAGVVFAVTFIVALMVTVILADPLEQGFVMALVGAIPIAVAGWLDDLKGLPVVTRLAVQGACAVWAAVWIVDYASLSPWLVPLLACVIMWVTNAFNFMDGLDGLVAAVSVLTVCTFIVLAGGGGLSIGPSLVVLLAGLLVFFAVNVSPASAFMGDVGSTTLGFVCSVFILGWSSGEVASLAVAFLPVSPLLVDATGTLVVRTLRGDVLHEPHRLHLYQLLYDCGASAGRIVTGYSAATLAATGVALVVHFGTGKVVQLPVSVVFVVMVFAAWFAVRDLVRRRCKGQ